MNFYDYFEELPTIIEDENQEIYHPITSLLNNNDTINDKKNLENVIFDKNFDNIENKLIPYYCYICGKNFLTINCKLTKLKRRKIDLSFVINSKEDNFFYKMYYKFKSINLIKINNKIEKRYFLKCKCGIEIGYYLNNDESIIFILKDSLAYDFKQCKVIHYLSKIPDLNK